MKNSIKILLTLLITLFSLNSFAYNPPDVPPNGTYVLDLANKLSGLELNELNYKIENLNRSTKNEYGVLLLSSMDGNSIDDVAYSTFNKWGIGKHGLDNGVLLVISFAERKTRIETGKGVEQDLTDLQSSDILQNTLKPQLKAGNVFQGISDTIDKCSSVIASRANEKATTTNNYDSNWWIYTLVIVSIGFGLAIIVGFFNRRAEEKERIEREERESKRLAHNARVNAEYKRTLLKTTPDLPHHHNIIKTAAVLGTGLAAAAIMSEEERREADRQRRRREEEDNRRRDESNSSSNSSSSSDSNSSSYTPDFGNTGSGFDGGGMSGGGGADGSF